MTALRLWIGKIVCGWLGHKWSRRMVEYKECRRCGALKKMRPFAPRKAKD